ncbi:MAG: tRNA lysidine(34) synthetase TilS, partial [bacterium]|nr:tRNA lysidine(34) synthetase TilS [bacterium]
SGQKLYLASRAKVAFNTNLEVAGRTEIPELGAAVICKSSPYRQGELVRQRRSRSVLLDRLKVQMPLSVRSLESGDSFVPLGMAGSKKVGEYLINRKVPRPLREETAVVCDRLGIVWLIGFEIAERVKIDEKTEEALSIEYS